MRATVITYHGVGDVRRTDDPYRLVLPTEKFRAQMTFLARYRTVVSLDDLVAGRMKGSKPVVAITFDDGYRSVLEIAAPILRAHHFPAVCFVPTAWIGASNTWDHVASSGAFEVMDDDELRAADRTGITIESHGATHAPLDQSDTQSAEADFASSVERLRDVIGRVPRYLAYPYGTQTPALRDAARRSGFHAAFSNGRPGAGAWAWPRVTIRREEGLRMFAFKTSGRYLAVRHSWIGAAAYSTIRPWILRRRTVVTS
jgi:peptidoglycan/xylan/chitin deacetylase (PgdA/CDA1 family)